MAVIIHDTYAWAFIKACGISKKNIDKMRGADIQLVRTSQYIDFMYNGHNLGRVTVTASLRALVIKGQAGQGELQDAYYKVKQCITAMWHKYESNLECGKIKNLSIPSVHTYKGDGVLFMGGTSIGTVDKVTVTCEETSIDSTPTEEVEKEEGDLGRLRDAMQVYEVVCGTNSDSKYIVAAILSTGIKAAVRRQGSLLSVRVAIRVEGVTSNDHEGKLWDTLGKQGFTVYKYQEEKEQWYASMHVELEGCCPKKALGAIILGLPGDLVDIAYKFDDLVVDAQ